MGAFSYNILADKRQCKDMLYVPCAYPQRSEYVISDRTEIEERLHSLDLVRIAADFAYIDEKQARNFSFSKYLASKEAD